MSTPSAMNAEDRDSRRAETDESLRVERRQTDRALGRRIANFDDDADEVLKLARERADRLLEATRAAADARLPLNERTKVAVALLLEQRDEEDRVVARERAHADDLLADERRQRRDKLTAHLELERQTTDRRLALERSSADRAVSSRDDFLAQASHDLRGLTAAQKIYLSLLVKAVTSEQPGDRLLEHVAALVKIEAYMDRLIGDLVDTVAIEAGRLTVTATRQSAQQLVSTASAVFESLAQERDQSLSLAVPAADEPVLADAGRVIQVLGNLLSNAIKFSPPEGAIRLGFEAAAKEAVFFVADDGPGIPPERAPDIFERFVGSDSHTGLGLGLFIASRLVEAHGGRLWFEPNAPAGTVFRFSLPRAT